MWESTVRLVGDDEAAHRALTQLKKAIRSRVTETELPESSQLQHRSPTPLPHTRKKAGAAAAVGGGVRAGGGPITSSAAVGTAAAYTEGSPRTGRQCDGGTSIEPRMAAAGVPGPDGGSAT